MNKFITTKINAPQAEKHQKKTLIHEFEENKKFMERFVVDCVLSVMEG